MKSFLILAIIICFPLSRSYSTSFSLSHPPAAAHTCAVSDGETVRFRTFRRPKPSHILLTPSYAYLPPAEHTAGRGPLACGGPVRVMAAPRTYRRPRPSRMRRSRPCDGRPHAHTAGRGPLACGGPVRVMAAPPHIPPAEALSHAAIPTVC